MVLDPFSALGLASNVVQFVDYGSRVISKTVEQYESAAGCSRGLVNTESIAQHLRMLAKSLEGDLGAIGNITGLQGRRQLGQTFEEFPEASDKRVEVQGRRKLTMGSRGSLEISAKGAEPQEHLRLSQFSQRTQEASDSEAELQRLAVSCHNLAVELIDMVNGLTLDPKLRGAKRGIQSLRQAFRTVGKERRIRALEECLDRYRSELTLHIAMLTR